MKIALIDETAEQRSHISDRLQKLNQSDTDSMNLEIRIPTDYTAAASFADADILLLGSGLGEKAFGVAEKARALSPAIQVIMITSMENYSTTYFKRAGTARIRKVLPENVTELDLLQELFSVHRELSEAGRAPAGKLVVITSPHGGCGVTSIAAALGEACNDAGKSTLLWDLDYETRDLCRGLSLFEENDTKVDEWVQSKADITRKDFVSELVRVAENAWALRPPQTLAASMDLFCHLDGIKTIQRMSELSRAVHDVTIIDAAGTIGPATGTLLSIADVVLMVTGDSVLNVSGIPPYLARVHGLINSGNRLAFLCPESGPGIGEVARMVDPENHLGDSPWRLPPIAFDPKAREWAGTGQTLYTMGKASTRETLDQIAVQLDLVERKHKASDCLPAIIPNEQPSLMKNIVQRLGGALRPVHGSALN